MIKSEFDWKCEDYKKDNSIDYHKIIRKKPLKKVTNKTMNKDYRQIIKDKFKIDSLDGLHTHHIDGRHYNNNLINLIVVSPKEHGHLHHLLHLSSHKCKKGGERLQLLTDDTPKLFKKNDKYYYLFQHCTYANEDKLEKTHKEYVWAYSKSQLKYMIFIIGLYWDEFLEKELRHIKKKVI